MRLSSLLHTFVFLMLAVASIRADDSYRIVHTYPHDPRAYTQGLIYIDGHLYESTGLNGRSSLRMEDLATGRALQSAAVPQQYFAEGLAAWGSTLVQLTWQSHVAFVYDRFSFRLLRTLRYDCDGWGLTADSKNLILSDGTAEIRFIVRISPETGRVLGWINLAGLLRPGEVTDQEAVLNGIAYDAAHDRLFVTGKLWPRIFEIKVVPAPAKVVPVRHAR